MLDYVIIISLITASFIARIQFVLNFVAISRDQTLHKVMRRIKGTDSARQ
jgi:hypothetical protein